MKQSLMPADLLRTKLKALVEKWRRDQHSSEFPESMADLRWAVGQCADQLAALLAESEPESEPRYFKPAPKAWGLSGHLQIHPEPPDCEAKRGK